MDFATDGQTYIIAILTRLSFYPLGMEPMDAIMDDLIVDQL